MIGRRSKAMSVGDGYRPRFGLVTPCGKFDRGFDCGVQWVLDRLRRESLDDVILDLERLEGRRSA